MNINPTIQVFQTPVLGITRNRSESILDIPRTVDPLFDANYIANIRCQPLPNDIEKHTKSEQKNSIANMVQLLGVMCEENSIDGIKSVVSRIHDELSDELVSIARGWVRYISNKHPKVDDYIKNNLDFFRTPYSEVIGTNTIMYYADEHSIDFMFWARNPLFKHNKIVWTTEPQPAPSYIRESIRQKMPSQVVSYIQGAGQTISSVMRRNIIYDALTTTEDGTGAEILQTRPIPKKIPHGTILNSDYEYNEDYISSSDGLKALSKDEAIAKLDESGFLIHVLVNHLSPLILSHRAIDKVIELKSPIGVEDTFPTNSSSETSAILNNGQLIFPAPMHVDDSVLVPKEVVIDAG